MPPSGTCRSLDYANTDRPMAPTTFWSQDVSSGYAVGFPGVAHIVADLDDLDALAIATPITAGRHRAHRASVLRRDLSCSALITDRRLACGGCRVTQRGGGVAMAVAAWAHGRWPRRRRVRFGRSLLRRQPMNARTASIVATASSLVVDRRALLPSARAVRRPIRSPSRVQVAAVLLMVWARMTFGRRSFHAAANPTAGGLVTWGPYRYWRHPIYSAILLFLWSGVLSHGARSGRDRAGSGRDRHDDRADASPKRASSAPSSPARRIRRPTRGGRSGSFPYVL